MANSVRLLKIGISGFKTFPDSVDIPLAQGLTAIIGPNGCGKTNLFDALRFVMGESAPKALRCHDMDETIFAGNEDKARRNIAEVTLWLHVSNPEDLPFPVSDNTLEISRRIERGVGSQWRINGREVRARDVTLLLGDMATGARSSMIMAQNTIHRFIESPPLQRRSFLEEAAGMSGLYARRDEATRKLSSATNQMERIEDLLQELKSQQRKLKKDAALARNYISLKKRVKAIEQALLIYEQTMRQQKKTQTQQALEEDRRQLKQKEALLVIAERRWQRLQEMNKPLQQKMEHNELERQELKSEFGSLNVAQHHRHNNIAMTQKRLQELEKDRITTQSELERALQQVEEYQKESSTDTKTIKDQLQNQLQEKNRLWQENQKRVEEAQRLYEQDKQQHIQHQEAQKEAQRQQADLAHYEQQLKALPPTADHQHSLDDVKKQLAGWREKIQETHRLDDDWQQKERAAESDAGRLQQKLSQFQSLSADSMIHHVSVAPDYEHALAAALGYDLDASHKGQKDQASWHELPPLSERITLAPPLSDYVTAPASLQRRLQQVGVCNSQKEGHKLWHQLTIGQRLVSKDGYLWRWDGFVAPPAANTEQLHILQRQKNHEQMQKDHDALRQTIQDIKQQRKTLSEQRQQYINEEQQCQKNYETVYEQSAQMRQTIERRAELNQLIASVKEKIAAHQKAITAMQEQTHEPIDEKQLREWQDQSKQSGHERDAALQEWAQWEASHKATQKQHQAWQQTITHCEKTLNQLEQRHQEATQQYNQLQKDEEKSNDRVAQLKPLITEAERKYHLWLHQKKRMERWLTLHKSQLESIKSDMEQLNVTMARHEERLAQSQTLDEEMLSSDELPTIANDDEYQNQKLECQRGQARLEQMENDGGINMRAQHDMAEIVARTDQLKKEAKDVEQAIGTFRQAVRDINQRGRKKLKDTFTQINKHFARIFSQLFAGGHAAMSFVGSDDPLEAGIDVAVRLAKSKSKSLSLLSGGERSMTALALMFAIFATRPAPVCLLDEVDDSLDEKNIDLLCSLLRVLTRDHDTRFIMVTHRPLTMSFMDRLYGVTMPRDGISHLVALDIKQAQELSKRQKSVA